jgi:hypothetical protein
MFSLLLRFYTSLALVIFRISPRHFNFLMKKKIAFNKDVNYDLDIYDWLIYFFYCLYAIIYCSFTIRFLWLNEWKK